MSLIINQSPYQKSAAPFVSGYSLKPGGFNDRLRDGVKIIQVFMHMHWIESKQCFYQLTGNKKKVKVLTKQLSHLLKIFNGLWGRTVHAKTWGDQLLVPAFNVTKMSAVHEPSRYQEAHAALLHKANFAWLHPSTKRPITPLVSGLCAGACIDFAARLLELEQTYPIDSEAFKQGMVQLSQKYRYGIGKKGFANQAFYRKLQRRIKEEGKNTDLGVRHLEVIVQNYVDAYKKGENFDEVLDLAKSFIPEMATYLPIIEEINQVFIDQLSGKKDHNVNAFVEVVHKHTVDNPDAASSLLPLSHLYEEEVRKFQRHLDIVSLKETPEIAVIDSLKCSHMAAEPVVKLKHKYCVSQNLPTQDYLKIVAEHRGLDLKQTNRDISSQNSDDDNIAQLSRLNDGVYETIIDTQCENVKHAILFIKSGGETFIWDPNCGLLDCLRNPSKTFKKLLEEYPTKTHAIQMRQFTPLRAYTESDSKIGISV